ncbi:hypothetical protein ABZ883_26355 [Streptomyces sp. NPDC046977]|uniref:DUF6907 domain-containing protein n=1 Tax=Streptomyces sp. NPDC046977 TaxID=3154703 RepID=UPI0033CF4201
MKPITVTIPTCDHGDVTIDEPMWCAGDHPAGGYRVDITHRGPEMVLDVLTSRGRPRLLSLALESRPFTELPPGTSVFVNVGISDDFYPHTVADLHRLAETLMLHASRVRYMAGRLAIQLGEDQR